MRWMEGTRSVPTRLAAGGIYSVRRQWFGYHPEPPSGLAIRIHPLNLTAAPLPMSMCDRVDCFSHPT